jgi:hypothetical protein
VLDAIKVSLTVPSESIWELLLIVAGEIFGAVGQEWLNFARESGDIEVAGEAESPELKKMRILRRILS